MPDDPIGGKYRIAERIAAGGMGEVYRATMLGMGDVEKTVAIKLVRSDLAEDETFSEAFVQEARVAMRLSHANLVQAFDVGRIDDRWFLAMEFVEGFDLAHLLYACDESVPTRHIVYLAIEVLKGLDYAHRRRSDSGDPLGIVHRDISPGNVLISVEGEVKIADFGIASSTLRVRDSEASVIKGKIPYMAPEQLQGSPVDRRADLYALGSVLYEALTGRRTVSDDRESIPKVIVGDYPTIHEQDPQLSKKLAEVVHRALALDPADRYPTAAAMRQALERLAVDEGMLLSAPDLADFALRVTGDEAEERQSSPSIRPPALEPVGAPATGAFDSFLGAELSQVQSAEGFSVFTATLTAPVEVATEDESSAPIEATVVGAREPVEKGPARGYWIVAALVFGVGLIAFYAFGQFGSAPVAVGPAVSEDDQGDDETPAEASPNVQTERTAMATESTPEQLPAIVPEEPPSEMNSVVMAAPPQMRPVKAPPIATNPAMTEVSVGAEAVTTPGTLSFNTDPWSYVYLDGRNLGATPVLNHSVSAGRHRVRFDNPSEGLMRSLVVEVAAGQHRRVTLDL